MPTHRFRFRHLLPVCALVLLPAPPLRGQPINQTARRAASAASLPASCFAATTVKDVLISGGKWYLCSAANTWTLAGPGAAPGYPLLASDGTAAAPSYSFSADTNTGIFRDSADVLAFSTGGVERWVINASGALNPLVNNTYDIGNGTVSPRDVNAARYFASSGTAFASLGTPGNGAITYCTNCTTATPCASGGTGALAVRANSAWSCGGGSGGLATDGSTVGATAQSQVFTSGVTTTATTGKVGIGMTAAQMLDITAASGLIAINIIGTQPASVGGTSSGTAAADALVATGATGGNTTSNSNGRQAGAGGDFLLTTGAGGINSGTGNSFAEGGAAGQFYVQGGTGGAATGATGTATAGGGGSVQLSAGTGGQATTHVGQSGAGGSVGIAAGTGGDNAVSGGASGDGGGISIDAGAAGSASGGASSGVNGTVTIGIGLASALTLGNAASTTSLVGGQLVSVAAKTADFTFASSDYLLTIDATGGNVTGTLIACGTVGRVYRVKRLDGSGNTVTVARAGADTIDGATTSTFTAQYQTRDYVCTASGAWSVF